MSLISSLAQTFRSVASRDFTHNLQFFTLIRLLSSDNSENSSPQAYKIRSIMPLDQRYVTAYHLFLEEKTRSKEKVEGLKEYARMWRELPDSVKQEYHDKAQKSNESNKAILIEKRRPRFRHRVKKQSKTEHPDEVKKSSESNNNILTEERRFDYPRHIMQQSSSRSPEEWDDRPSYDTFSTNPYKVFLQEKAVSKIPDQDLEEYAKMWKELPDSAKQKYRDLSFAINKVNSKWKKSIIEQGEDKGRKLTKRKKKKHHKRRPNALAREVITERQDGEMYAHPERVFDKFMNQPYEEKPRRYEEFLEKADMDENPSAVDKEKSKKVRPRKNRASKGNKDEYSTKPKSKTKQKCEAKLLEKLPKQLTPINPYWLFMKRISPKLPYTSEKAGQILGLWKKLKKEKAEYKRKAKEMTVKKRECKQLLGDLTRKFQEEDYNPEVSENLDDESTPSSYQTRWIKGPWNKRMDQLIDHANVLASKDLTRFKNLEEVAFPKLTPEELEHRKSMLKDYITSNKDNTYLKNDHVDKQFEVTIASSNVREDQADNKPKMSKNAETKTKEKQHKPKTKRRKPKKANGCQKLNPESSNETED